MLKSTLARVRTKTASSPSVTAAASAATVTTGAESSSVIVSVASCGAVTPCVFVAVAETVSCLFPSYTALFAAVIVTSPVLARESAGIVSARFVLSA